RLFPLHIGQTLREQFEADMEIEVAAVKRLREGIAHMRSVDDHISRRLFETILEDEEHHLDYLETQLGLLDRMGEALYVQSVTEHPSPGGEH
ncbi:MAG: bacterioferritin, partial [Actinomycetota bacterium]|nr:bacterioferritin [Actinomycetota bacterium]